MKFKTTIKCSACVAAVRPALDELVPNAWEVDLSSPDRVLTIHQPVDPESVKAALKKSGYTAESI
jgi:copper chaperone CopZ